MDATPDDKIMKEEVFYAFLCLPKTFTESSKTSI